VKITLIYICVTHGIKTAEFASRFARTYHQHLPGVEHSTVVACNGGPLSREIGLMFDDISPIFWPRKNDDGWDVSAYMEAAKTVCHDSDMMVCIGESNYFHRQGWLKRLCDTWTEHGPGMYGPYATNVVRGHLQTTAFCCSPEMLRNYSLPVTDRAGRYEFEHGPRSLWRQVAKHHPVRLVTFDGSYPPTMWRTPNNVLWKGNQTNCLMWSNHTDRYRDAKLELKLSWERSANRPFK
jgi:hypothetical protein